MYRLVYAASIASHFALYSKASDARTSLSVLPYPTLSAPSQKTSTSSPTSTSTYHTSRSRYTTSGMSMTAAEPRYVSLED